MFPSQRERFIRSFVSMALLSIGLCLPLSAQATEVTIDKMGYDAGIALTPARGDLTLYSPAGITNPDRSSTVILDFENQFQGYFYASLNVYVDGTLRQVVRLDNAAVHQTLTLPVRASHNSETAQIRLVVNSQYYEDACFDERIGPGLLTLLPTTRFVAANAEPSLRLAWATFPRTPVIGIPPKPSNAELTVAAVVADALRDEGYVPSVRSEDAGPTADIQIQLNDIADHDIRLSASGQIVIHSAGKSVLDAIDFGLLRQTATPYFKATGIGTPEHRAIDQRAPIRSFAYRTGELAQTFKLSEFAQGQVPDRFIGQLALPVDGGEAPSQLYVYLNDHLLHSSPVVADGQPHPVDVKLDASLLELDNTIRMSIIRDEQSGFCDSLPVSVPFELLPGHHFATQHAARYAEDFVEFSTTLPDEIKIVVDPAARVAPSDLAELAGLLSWHYRPAGAPLELQAVETTDPSDQTGPIIHVRGDQITALSANPGGQAVQVPSTQALGAIQLVRANGTTQLHVSAVGSGPLQSPDRLHLSKGDLAVFDGTQTRYELSTKQTTVNVARDANEAEGLNLSSMLNINVVLAGGLFVLLALWGLVSRVGRGN